MEARKSYEPGVGCGNGYGPESALFLVFDLEHKVKIDRSRLLQEGLEAICFEECRVLPLPAPELLQTVVDNRQSIFCSPRLRRAAHGLGHGLAAVKYFVMKHIEHYGKSRSARNLKTVSKGKTRIIVFYDKPLLDCLVQRLETL